MSENTTDLTEDTFAQTLKDNDVVLIDYWASWCGPCRQFAPIYDQVAAEYPDVLFGKVDTEAEQGIAAAAQITSIPTLMAFRQGILVFEQSGVMPARTLRELVDQVKGLDMDAVRAEIEKARNAPAEPALDPSDPASIPRPGQAPQGGVPGVDFPDENGAVV